MVAVRDRRGPWKKVSLLGDSSEVEQIKDWTHGYNA